MFIPTFNVFAQATDDNEINIEQVGDTLTLYIDQYGYGNKIGLPTIFQVVQVLWYITGSSLDY